MIHGLAGGVFYDLSFDLSQSPLDTNLSRKSVKLVAAIVGNTTITQTFLNTGSGTQPTWQKHHFFFTAQSTTQQLTFTRPSAHAQTKGHLDNLKIVKVPMGGLKVAKVISPDPQGIGSAMSFSISANCSNPTYVLSHTISSSSPVTLNLPIGSICIIVENTPLPTLAPGCSWQAPVYSPANVTISNVPSTATVTNGYHCKPQKLTVKKVVTPDPQGLFHSLSFSMTVTCSNPSAPPPPNPPHQVGFAGSTWNVPMGSSCSVVENSPLPTLPVGCTWNAPVYTPANVTITNSYRVLTVTNGYSCTPNLARLSVKKVISPDPLGNRGHWRIILNPRKLF